MEMEKKEKKTKLDSSKLPNIYRKKGNFLNSLKLDDLNQNPNNDKNDELNSSSNSNGDSNNDKPSNYLFNKEKNNTNASEENQMDKNEEEKNSKYNDTNFWQTNTESLVNEKEMQNLIDDL